MGESKANGRVEEAGKTIREYTRTYKDQIEYNTGHKLETDDDILQWMVRWTVLVYTRFRIGRDGRTAYERLKGRKCKALVVLFGEKV